jgi:hypothetical protein
MNVKRPEKYPFWGFSTKKTSQHRSIFSMNVERFE